MAAEPGLTALRCSVDVTPSLIYVGRRQKA
jgi:hypothetical protein